ncbi:ABC transporter permease subunit [Microbacterium oryzae]|uniref:ABC transporter permease subunit n=1 Tax=Microbacterium oryzae TaxID=743009 RepID=UPI0025B15BA1|nr:ABC transporter permease subunit [Microbacterium oryzae]
MIAVFARALAESWRALLIWTLAITAVMMLYLSLYPSIGLDGQMMSLLETLPPSLVNTLGFDQIATGAGYAQATFYGLLGFVLPTVAAIGWGSAAVAGAEEQGRLELDLAHGISRSGYVAGQALALVARLLWLGVYAGALLAVVSAPFELDLERANIVPQTAAAVGLWLFSGSAALLVGALTGRRAWATGAGALVAAAAFLFNGIANQNDDFDVLRAFSPYSWAFHETPLADGPSAGLWPLWISVAVLLAGSVMALTRRDIRG